ncbi:MAG: sigma 54-interacting transcriptional regulator [Desulfotalea sp.]
MKDMKSAQKLKLVVVAVQYGYLKKITGQLETMFGDLIEVRSFQLGMLDKERIEPDEVLFSTIPNLEKLVQASFPQIRGFISAGRSINLVNTGEILSLEPGRRILVVGDHQEVTQKIIQELTDSHFNHQYIPFHPEYDHAEPVDCAVTSGEVELVPDFIDHVINIGLRVISLETMQEINGRYMLDLGFEEMNRQYILSLVHVATAWAVSKKNKYISNWIGTKIDDNPDQKFHDFISQSQAMKTFISQARQLAITKYPVHIDGTIGVGKRRGAIAIHNESRFHLGKFFCVNCTCEKKSLEENLFGWEDGNAAYPGLLELAHEGTVCIEEIEYMDQSLQEKLASFLRDGYLVREGGNEEIELSTRLVTTSTLPLAEAFKSKKIRQKLYHHLSLHICTMPTLAERKDDFDQLLKKYLEQGLGRPELEIEDAARTVLKAYSWEGNVQEFYNVLFHLACLGQQKITMDMIPFYIHKANSGPMETIVHNPALNCKEIIEKIETSGVLAEYLEILDVYLQGKKENRSFGRAVVIEYLEERGLTMSKQKLRLKQERLNKLGLLNVMKGRAGTTISRIGEEFLTQVQRGNS